MSDVCDLAADLEIKQREQALKAALSKSLESQDIDDKGNHYCNDCGDLIPAARIGALPDAVCCIDCQEFRERKGKHFV